MYYLNIILLYRSVLSTFSRLSSNLLSFICLSLPTLPLIPTNLHTNVAPFLHLLSPSFYSSSISPYSLPLPSSLYLISPSSLLSLAPSPSPSFSSFSLPPLLSPVTSQFNFTTANEPN